jgi:hypothetical protein
MVNRIIIDPARRRRLPLVRFVLDRARTALEWTSWLHGPYDWGSCVVMREDLTLQIPEKPRGKPCPLPPHPPNLPNG